MSFILFSILVFFAPSPIGEEHSSLFSLKHAVCFGLCLVRVHNTFRIQRYVRSHFAIQGLLVLPKSLFFLFTTVYIRKIKMKINIFRTITLFFLIILPFLSFLILFFISIILFVILTFIPPISSFSIFCFLLYSFFSFFSSIPFLSFHFFPFTYFLSFIFFYFFSFTVFVQYSSFSLVSHSVHWISMDSINNNIVSRCQIKHNKNYNGISLQLNIISLIDFN